MSEVSKLIHTPSLLFFIEEQITFSENYSDINRGYIFLLLIPKYIDIW